MATTTTRTPDIETLIDTTGLTLTFRNGETLRINVRDLTPTIAFQALTHGLKQKLVDAAAISRNPDTGRTASIDDKYKAVREVYDRLLSGAWNKPRDEAGTGSGGLLFRALCLLYPSKTPDAIRAFLDGKSAPEQTALRKSSKIAAIIEELKAAKAPDGDEVDTDALLGELDD